jgi:hypothetical protein
MSIRAIDFPVKLDSLGAFAVKGNRLLVGCRAVAAFPTIGHSARSADCDIGFYGQCGWAGTVKGGWR